MEMQTYAERLISKFELISDKHHKLSLLFYELSKSLKLEAKRKGLMHSPKKFKEYLKSLDLDYKKIESISTSMLNFGFGDLKK